MTEIIIAGPYCTPQRNAILTLLRDYGVTSARVTDCYAMYPDGDTGPADKHWQTIPIRLLYHVRVNPQAAAWAEYLLLRSGQFELISYPLEARNGQWAAQWGGQLPRPWAAGPCASMTSQSTAAIPTKPVALKDDSVGFRLLRQLRRNR